MWVAVFGLLTLIWSSSWIGIKYSLQGFPPFVGAGSRFALALLLLWLFGRIRGVSFRVKALDYRYVVITAFLLYLFDYGAIYWAEQKLSAGMTATFFSTFPIFTALFSQLFNKSEPVSPKTWWGLILGLGGVVLLFHREWRIVGWETVIPAGAVVIGAMGGAFHLVIVKKFLGHMNAITLTTHQMVWGSLMLLTIGTLKGEWSHVHTSPASLAAIGYLALVATALAFTLYYLMLQHCSAVTASLLVYCIPPVTLFLDWLVFQERVGLQTALAICIIFMGIGLSQQSQIRKKDLKKMVER